MAAAWSTASPQCHEHFNNSYVKLLMQRKSVQGLACTPFCDAPCVSRRLAAPVGEYCFASVPLSSLIHNIRV